MPDSPGRPDLPGRPFRPDRPLSDDPNSTVAILEALAHALPPEAIDELWIFPPRRVGTGQSTVVVASAFELPRSPASGEVAQPEIGEAGDVPPLADPAGTGEPVTETAEGDDVASDRRRILTARFTIGRNPRNQPELRHELAEHGAAPAERVGRVVDGVFRRLDDEPEPPRHARIGGQPERWAELLAELSGGDKG